MSINMKDQKFGVEIEFYGLTRDNAVICYTLNAVDKDPKFW